MICFPNAKINIGLNVVEKRPDGYHNIESIFYPIGLCDVLEIVENETFQFQSTGIDIPGDEQKNLCVSAYDLLKEDFDLPPVKIHLHKIIPIGAGLGGGSADAAFMINLLEKLFELNLPAEKKLNFAIELGSDCPFFIRNEPAFITGRGEFFEQMPIRLGGYYLILACPNIHVSTKEAYAHIKPQKSLSPLNEIILKTPVEQWRGHVHNQFEETVFKQHPQIKEIKEILYGMGAVYASMTGSGAAVYGIFEKKPNIEREFEEYCVWEGTL
ncbi:MAG: 4-(cytidine 5'-diphospho)-2-C-methyl-D-erythritol kinase [Flavobacteriales bacterium]|nr:MAG: 4-(cytidine 5'-diphospho)-2-C-methyl-D-erythritol kinase [Flavobacteriales bacterium]